MTEKHAFMDIGQLPDAAPGVLEQTVYQAVEGSSTAGLALQALDTARQALLLAAAAEQAARFAAAATSPATWRTYQASWRSWTRWCADNALPALPADPGHVALYIAWRARTRAAATIAGDLAAIAAAHRAGGLDNPTTDTAVRVVLRGIRRTNGTAQRRKTPLVLEAMRAVLATLADDVRGRRDRAMLLLGWGGALRRSELVALNWEDLQIVEEGLVLRVCRSKTDQERRGATVGLPRHDEGKYDPVRALCAWREVAGGGEGPVFRAVHGRGWIGRRRIGDREVARLVQRVCRAAGLEGDYSGHSLRAGFATAAAAAGAHERAIMAQTRHKSLEVMRGYIRPASIWIENAAAIAAL